MAIPMTMEAASLEQLLRRSRKSSGDGEMLPCRRQCSQGRLLGYRITNNAGD